jgi:hypothetical protein
LKGGQGGLTVVIVVDLKGVTFMTEKVLRRWLYILTVAVVVLFFETTIRFGFMSGFFRTHGLEVLNQDGKPVVFMGATPEGEGLIVLYDRVGFLRAAIVTTQLGDVAIKLFDGSGIQRVSIAVKVDGSVVMKGF